MYSTSHCQLLVAVLPLFASDIQWTCSGSSDSVRNVQNTGELMKAYLGEITWRLNRVPSDLRQEVDAIEELEFLLADLEDFLKGDILNESILHSRPEKGRMLQQIPSQDDSLRQSFPKLMRLSLLMDSSGDHGRFLRLEQKELRLKIGRNHAELLIKKLRELQQQSCTTTDPSPAKILASARRTQFNPQLWRCSNRIFDTLKEHLQHCTTQRYKHWVLLHLKGYNELERSDVHSRLDMLLASCSVSESWPEVHCTVADPESTLEVCCSLEGCDIVTDICQHADKTYDCNQIVKMHIREDRLLDVSTFDDFLDHPGANPSKSLSCIIESKMMRDLYRFPEKDKRRLALTLAQSFLQLYEGRWIQTSWTSKSLFFKYGEAEAKVYNIHQPYLSCFLSSEAEHQPDNAASLHKYPLVLSFARLLLEIETGEIIIPQMTQTTKSPDLLSTLHKRLQQWRGRHLNTDYASAIDACLKFQKLLPSGDKSLNSFRKVFLASVIAPLEREMARFPRTPLEKQDMEWKSKTKMERPVPQPVVQNTQRNSVDTTPSSPSQHIDVPVLSMCRKVVSPARGIAMFSDCDGDSSANKTQAAKAFLSKLEDFRKKHIHRPQRSSRIKIVVLDTGLQDEDFVIRQRRKAIRQSRRADAKEHRDPIQGIENFTEGPDHDEDGHGTDVIGLLLIVAPEANIYVGKISRQKKVGIQVQQISQALRWAIDEVEADIISMSFGFDNDSDWTFEMQKAIKDVDNADKIVFAAASNYGGNRKRTYPAKAPTVFCIHASDGDGNESGKDPTPLERADNFSTLGVLVPCRFDGDREIFKTGTSYATPVAAGIAANIMVLGDWLVEKEKLTSDQRRRLGAYEGMRSVFEQMAETRQRYDYVAPWHLWDGNTDEETVWGKIRERL